MDKWIIRSILFANCIIGGMLTLSHHVVMLGVILYSVIALWHLHRPIKFIKYIQEWGYRRHAHGILLGFLVFLWFAILGYQVRDAINIQRFLPLLASVNGLIVVYSTRNQSLANWPPVSTQTSISKSFLLFLVVLSSILTLWQINFSIPQFISDSKEYFKVSEQMLGNSGIYESPENPGYLSGEIVTYGYSTFLTLTRLISNTVFSTAIVQHIIRILVILLTYILLRQYDVKYARSYAVILAISPAPVVFAHMIMTESLYNPALIIVMVLIASLLRHGRFNPKNITTAVILGAMLVTVAWIRPAGNYLFVFVIPIFFFYKVPWRQIVAIVVSFVMVGLLISGGRWLIDREFTYRPTAESKYYLYGAIFHNIYEAENGPIAQGIADSEENCTFSYEELIEKYPGMTRNQDLARARSSNGLVECAEEADTEGSMGLLIEAIRAHPITYSLSVYDETAYFLTVPSIHWPVTNHGNFCYGLPEFVESNLRVNQDERPIIDYLCVWEDKPVDETKRTIFVAYNTLMLLFTQPYIASLIFFNTYTAFALGLFMLGVVWIRAPRRWHPIIIICLALILYHALSTAATFYTLPRYAMMLAPFHLIIVVMFYRLLFSSQIPSGQPYDRPQTQR